LGVPFATTPWHDSRGASDANAHIGGWLAATKNPSKAETWWFHYQVPLDAHAWAHKDGHHTRRISTLEMFGTLILTHFLLLMGA